MTKTELDVLWRRALREALEAGEEFTRYRFAAMVASAEREACALMCETEAANPSCLWEEPGCWAHAAENCAGAIRARSEA